MQHPIDTIQWLDAGTLSPNGYNPNRVFTPELRLLERNLLSLGWVQPIMVNENLVIIDGFHRWRLAQDSKALRARDGGLVPCAVLTIADDEAMALTVRMNRAKGTHIAVHMHALVARLLTEYEWTREQVAKSIGATVSEVDVLAQDGIFALKGTKDWAYSSAWYPVETGTRTKDDVE